MRVLKGHIKYTPPSSGKEQDTFKKLTCVHVIQKNWLALLYTDKNMYVYLE